MMTKEDISALEASIKNQSDSLYSISFNYLMSSLHGMRDDERDEEDDEEKRIYYALQILYLKMRCYFECKSLVSYLRLFIEKIDPLLETQATALDISGPYFSQSDPYLTVFVEMRNFLAPFPAFEDHNNREKDIKHVEEVLNNSSNIVSHGKVTIKNESDVYSEVKWFLEILFPTTRNLGKARFIKKFKTYHPDILISEVKIAIEYKLIREHSNFDEYVDQVKTDADNYEGDPEFNLFYAVFYVLTKSLSKRALLESWKERKFPENWHPIIVFG